MMESLPQEARVIDISPSGKTLFEPSSYPVSIDKKLQISESVSWTICFAIVATITGALLIYKIGVTMSEITSILFYSSLVGLVFFVVRIIRLRRSGDGVTHIKSPHLN